ncbi:MAG TPA: SurA N-terminal domain-containing protein, partial [Clostridia bacterium]|nr:SurA N-terminal domain-containing protein [Clostridia bacterium]
MGFRKMTKACLIASILCMAFIINGCGMVKLDVERDLNQVVAVVDGSPIYKRAFLMSYQQQYYNAYLSGQNLDERTSEGRSNVKKLKNQILDSLIMQEFL